MPLFKFYNAGCLVPWKVAKIKDFFPFWNGFYDVGQTGVGFSNCPSSFPSAGLTTGV